MTSAAPGSDTVGSGTVTIGILGRSALEVAPDGVFFRASVRDESVAEAGNRQDHDPSFHACTYVWSFGDPGAASDKVVNVAAAHNDLDCAYGKEVGHVFTRPGRYTVTCTVHGPGGFIGRAETTLSVRDPDAVFAGEATILLDPDGTGDPETYPEAIVVKTLEEARAAFEAREEEDEEDEGEDEGEGQEARQAARRILLRRGTSWTYDTTLGLGDSHANLFLGAYGAGPHPVISAGAEIDADTRFIYAGRPFRGDMVVQGLDLRGPWDPLSESGTRLIGIDMVDAALAEDAPPNPRMAVIDDCRLSGFDLPVYLPQHLPAGAVTNTHINNSLITDWAGYAVYGGDLGDGAVSITGTTMAQNEDAPSGGSQAIGVGNSQGPLRTAKRGRIYCAVSDFFSRCGWSRIEGLPADQPCLRWNTHMAPGASGHFERCAFEGGNFVVTSTNSEGGNPPRPPGNFVLEKSLVVGTATTYQLVSWEANAATFRNNLLIRPDTLIPYPSIRWDAAFQVASPDTTPMTAPDAPMRIYSNTYVNLMGASTSAGSTLAFDNGAIDAFEFFSNENNVTHLPKQPRLQREDPGLARREFETVGGTWRSRYRGLRHGDGRMITAYATPPRSVFVFSPVPGEASWNSAAGRVAFDDFFGRVRGEMPDQGAIETD